MKKIKRKQKVSSVIDAEGFGDTSGMTGITADNKDNEKNISQNKGNDFSEEVSVKAYKTSKKIKKEKGQRKILEVLNEDEKPEFGKSASPSVKGEESVSGDMPVPESDDDTLQNAQDMGTQLNEDEEHPKPVDLGRDVDAAEKYHKEN